jgi:membrane fusion protein (multidrug efflux system)
MDVYNDNKTLLPGMAAEVNLPLPAKDSSFVVPKSALVNSTVNPFVIRVVNQKAAWVNVQPGRSSENNVEIFGNLSPGDQLIKTASEEIRDGSTIRTKASPDK